MRKLLCLVAALLLCALLSAPAAAIQSEHSWSEWETQREPSCTQAGLRTRTCTADAQHPHTQSEEIPPLGHAYTQEEIAPTCTEAGERRLHCLRCGFSYSEAFGEASGHDMEHSVLREASCTLGGQELARCRTCGESSVTQTPALGHSEQLQSTQPPGCTLGGVRYYLCERCGETRAEPFAHGGLGHRFVQSTSSDAFYCYTETACSVCAYVQSSTKTLDAVAVAEASVGTAAALAALSFAAALTPDILVLRWYRRRRQLVLLERERNNTDTKGVNNE